MAEVRGLEKVTAALRTMGPQAAKRIEEALDQGAEEVRARAVAIAPRDSGELASAVEVRRSLDGLALRGAVGNFARMTAMFSATSAAAGLARYIGVFPRKRGDPGWYAAWVEFGTEHSAARPFLRPAFWSLRRRVRSRISRAVNQAIKEAAARGR